MTDRPTHSERSDDREASSVPDGEASSVPGGEASSVPDGEASSTSTADVTESSAQLGLTRRSALFALGAVSLAGLGSGTAGASGDHFGETWSGVDSEGLSIINEATSGQTVGLYAEVDSADGYGLYTPDDVYLDGAASSIGTWKVDTHHYLGEDEGGNVIQGHPANGLSGTVTKEDVFGATIAGGGSTTDGTDSTNTIASQYVTIGGGKGNHAGYEGDGPYSTIGGGLFNWTRNPGDTIGGGIHNLIEEGGLASTIGGGESNEIFLRNRHVTVAGGLGNAARGNESTISGGSDNSTSRTGATVGGGASNRGDGRYASIGGGEENTVSDEHATVSGGDSNAAEEQGATVAGGANNTAGRALATVGGGRNNDAVEVDATVAGGRDNDATGVGATVPGGRANEASGTDSFAAGRGAVAEHDGAFVWSDSSSGQFASTGENQFLIDADGGVGIGTDSPERSLHVRPDTTTIGLVLQNSGDGSGTADGGWGMGAGHDTDRLNFYWNDDVASNWGTPVASINTDGEFSTNSDARLKRDVQSLEGVLEDVLSLRPTRYRFKGTDDRSPSFGFIAQEVRELFPELVRKAEDKRGTLSLCYDQFAALVVQAIKEQQELIDARNDRVEELETSVDDLKAENDELRERLRALESTADVTPAIADGGSAED